MTPVCPEHQASVAGGLRTLRSKLRVSRYRPETKRPAALVAAIDELATDLQDAAS